MRCNAGTCDYAEIGAKLRRNADGRTTNFAHNLRRRRFGSHMITNVLSLENFLFPLLFQFKWGEWGMGDAR